MDRATRGWVLVVSLGVPLVVAACDRVDGKEDGFLGGDVAARIVEVQRLGQLGQWEPMGVVAESLLEDLEPGTADWFVTSTMVVRSAYERWDTETLERVARASGAAMVPMRRREALNRLIRSPRSRLKLGLRDRGLDPLTTRAILESELRLAWLLQHRGRHVDALGHLNLILQDLQAGGAYEGDSLGAMAALAAGRSLRALGREEQALQMLGSAAERYGEYAEGAQAAVLFAGMLGGAYRGRYSGDAGHARLRSAVARAVGPARERLATALGWELDRIPPVVVGVADRPDVYDSLVAFTDYDPRRPEFAAVTVFLAQALAFDRFDPETILVHELAHAALWRELGTRYMEVPLWLTEGLCMALAGQFELEVEQALGVRLQAHRAEFASGDYWERHPPRLAPLAGMPVGSPGQEEPMLVMILEEAAGGRGVAILIDALVGGASVEKALRRATGMGLAAFRVKAVSRLQEIMERHRAPSVGFLSHLLVSMADAGPGEVEEYVREALEGELPTLARGWAQVTLAWALQEQERYGEADAVWSGLVERRREYPAMVERALQGRAVCLAPLGQREEGLALLRALAEEAPSPTTKEWAERCLRESGER